MRAALGVGPDAVPVTKLEMTTRELMLILEGIDHRDVKFRKRMNRRSA